MTDDLGRGSYKIDADATDAERELDQVEADAKASLGRAEQEATAAGTRTTSKLASLSSAAVKTVALGASALFAATTALAVQGQDAMAKYQAETGATADEARAALRDMNALAGQNLQSFSDVADVLTQVRTQMGLTGDEGRDMADSILKFATATGQSATDAVMAFDDIGDAWNLSATEQKQVMDALVASHQEYGGTIADSQALLQQLAPTLQAANMSWQDATAILNLFNHAGVDAAAAGTGLNRALQKVKSPEELQQLLRDIAAIQDPFERAQKAAEVFGARAGPKLAQALADSHGDISQFKVDMADAAGATDKAAQAIQDTLPNKVKMAVSGALASLRGMGTDFGPALTGAASLISLGTSFASALRLDKALSEAVKKAIGSQAMTSALTTLGGGAGTTFGKAFSAGATVAIGAGLGLIFFEIMTRINKAVGILPSDTADAIHQAFLAAQDMGPQFANAFFQSVTQAVHEGKSQEEQLRLGQAAVEALARAIPTTPPQELTDRLTHMWSAQPPIEVPLKLVTTTEGAGAFHGGLTPSGQEVDAAQRELTDRLTHMWTNVGIAVHRNIQTKPTPVAQMPQQVAQEAPKAEAAISDVLTHMWSAVPTAPARVLGMGYATEFANGLKAGKAEVASGMAELRDALEHPLRGIKTVAKVEGALASKELAEGLKSQDPYTRATAEATRDGLLAKLRKLQSMGYDIGKKGMHMLGEGVTDGTGDAVGKTGTAVSKVNAKLDGVDAKGAGHTIGYNWASAIAAAITASVRDGNLHDALVRVSTKMQVGSPSPKEGPLHGVEKGGYLTGRNYATAMADGLASVGLSKQLGGLLPGSLGVQAGMTVQHTGTVQVQLTSDTIAAARAQGATWSDVGAMARAAMSAVVDDMARMRTLPVGTP